MPPEMKENTPLLTENNALGKTERETSCSKCRSVYMSIRIELTMIFYSLCYGIETVFQTNLLIDKICAKYYSPGVCKNLDTGQYPQEQDAVQDLTNEYNIYLRLIEYIPGILVMVLLGAWSDRRDRKWPILVSLTGLFLKGIMYLVNCYWWSLPPQWLLVCFLPIGLTGSVIGLYTGAYAYISAMTSGRSRTARLAIVGIILHIISPIGQALAEVLYDRSGYVAVFGTYTIIMAVALLYSIVRLEKHPEGFQEHSSTGICQALSPKSVKETFLVAFRQRKEGVRGFILGYIAVVSLYVFGRETKIFNFLYCRKKFDWEHAAFTIWSIVDTPLTATGTLLVIPVLSYRFRVEDAILAFIGGVSMLFCYIVRATAPQPWVMYLSSIVGVCVEMISVSSRAAVSKLVEPSELGAVFATLSVGEAIIPIISPSIYTAIYNNTVDFFPGMVYLLAAGMTCIILVILVWILTRRLGKGLYREVTPVIKK